MTSPTAFHDREINQKVRDLANHHLGAINHKKGTHYTSLTVNRAYSQVLAGTNWFLHVTTNDGTKLSVTIHKYFHMAHKSPKVVDVHEGHKAPHSPHH